MSYFVVDTFSPVPFHGNPAAVVCIDKSNSVDNALKQKLASEFNLTASSFLTPVDTDDFQTAQKFALQWFTPEAELNLCGNGTLAAAHVLHNNLRNPNEEFEFETQSGPLKAHVKLHDFVKVTLPSFPIYSLNSHKQGLTELEEFDDSNGIGKKIASLIPSDITVNQLVYSPDLKYLLIALDQSTTHEQFTSLKLTPSDLLKIDPKGDFVHAVIVSFHFIPNEQSSFKNFLALTSQSPDYVLRCFEPWVGIDEDPATGSAQCVAAKFWGKVYNRNQNLRAHQHHPKRSSEFRIDEVGDKSIVISGHALTVFSGIIAVDKILK